MTPEQTKKYEEAAKQHLIHTKTGMFEKDEKHGGLRPDIENCLKAVTNAFFAGASLASQDTEERVKQAHNAALDKLAEVIRERQKELLSPERWAGVQVCIDEIQKLKL